MTLWFWLLFSNFPTVTFTGAKSDFNDYVSDTLYYVASNDWMMNFMEIE
jgi:hypothetical protein